MKFCEQNFLVSSSISVYRYTPRDGLGTAFYGRGQKQYVTVNIKTGELYTKILPGYKSTATNNHSETCERHMHIHMVRCLPRNKTLHISQF